MFPKSASNNLDSCYIYLKKFEKRRLPALCYFMLKFRERLFCSLGEIYHLEHSVIIIEYLNPFLHRYEN